MWSDLSSQICSMRGRRKNCIPKSRLTVCCYNLKLNGRVQNYCDVFTHSPMANEWWWYMRIEQVLVTFSATISSNFYCIVPQYGVQCSQCSTHSTLTAKSLAYMQANSKARIMIASDGALGFWRRVAKSMEGFSNYCRANNCNLRSSGL